MAHRHRADGNRVGASVLLARAVLLWLLALSASACSGNLSRNKAEELIRSKFKFPTNEQKVDFRLSWDYYCFGGRYGAINPCGPDAMPAEVKALQSLGLITVAYDGYTSRLSLTENGQKYAAGEAELSHPSDGGNAPQTNYLATPLWASTLEFGSITGITEVDGTKSARVEFTAIRNPTPFGKYPVPSYNDTVAPATIAMTATFVKYDDGWRITGTR